MRLKTVNPRVVQTTLTTRVASSRARGGSETGDEAFSIVRRASSAWVDAVRRFVRATGASGGFAGARREPTRRASVYITLRHHQ